MRHLRHTPATVQKTTTLTRILEVEYWEQYGIVPVGQTHVKIRGPFKFFRFRENFN
jgi:hypothetical protein